MVNWQVAINCFPEREDVYKTANPEDSRGVFKLEILGALWADYAEGHYGFIFLHLDVLLTVQSIIFVTSLLPW